MAAAGRFLADALPAIAATIETTPIIHSSITTLAFTQPQVYKDDDPASGPQRR